ncbi:MAG: hypothetical protein ABWX94_03825 [Candidatus Saccharimonadales bacterium]
MKLQKFRWSKVYESNEEELIEWLAARSVTAKRLSVEAFDSSSFEGSNTETTIWCAEGSLTFRMGDSSLSIQAGDGLRIPISTPFSMDAGMVGYVLYQE